MNRPFVQENDQPKGTPTLREVLEGQAVPDRLRLSRLRCFDRLIGEGFTEAESYSAANQIIHIQTR
jgi:hypothetical protein